MESLTELADDVSGKFCRFLPFLEARGVCAYEYFGLHRAGDAVILRAHAPECDAVSAVGDFNAWSPDASPMQKNADGEWETVIDGDSIKDGQNYKLFVTQNGMGRYCADPFAKQTECSPNGASVVCDASFYEWRDEGWLVYRKARFSGESAKAQPVNAYRVSLDTWAPKGDTPKSLSVTAERLAIYVKQMGYTHVELEGINPCTLSPDGDRLGSRYAPDARLGAPVELKEFVDLLHEAGIGVLLDLAVDDLGFALPLGQPLWELSSHGLIEATRSELCFWAREYHVDGFCLSFAADVEQDVLLAFAEAILQRAGKALPDVILSLRARTDVAARYVSDPVLNGRIEALAARAREEKSLSLASLLRLASMTLPGKKRTVMGREILPFAEGGDGQVPWELLGEASHAAFQLLSARLNHLYLKEAALWERDAEERLLVSLVPEDVKPLIGYLLQGKREHRLAILINPTDERIEVSVPSTEEARCLLFVGDAPEQRTEGEALRVGLPSKSGCVLAL